MKEIDRGTYGILQHSVYLLKTDKCTLIEIDRYT